MGKHDAGYERYIDGLLREVERLQAENDRLRELVADYGTFVALAGIDLRYRHDGRELSASALKRRMRELGVEVDE